jgi:predicted metal-dependent phosphoesterase TrpH
VIDLHTHSTVSDGTEIPERVVQLAHHAGVTAVALTDHDRLEGVAAARGEGARVGVEVIAGCEISCAHSGSLHLLVYFLEPGAGPLQDELGRLQALREQRNRRLAERLAGMGLPVTHDEMVAEAGGGGVGSPHAAAVLVRKGVVGSVGEAFERWLAKGRPAYVERPKLSPATAIGLARVSGAVPVVAHPLSLRLEPAELTTQLRELAEAGLQGLEAVYGRYSPDQRNALAAVAGALGLVATGGSDFHGSYKPDLSVGVGRGDLAVDASVLDALRERQAS